MNAKHPLENLLEFHVRGDGMAPAYCEGDLIYAGKPLTDANEIREQLLDRDCVVRLDSGEELLRRIEACDAQGRFTLSGLKVTTLHNVALVSAAPVIWIRKAVASIVTPLRNE